MRLSLPLLLSLTACATAPVKVALPPGQAPFEGCQRSSPGPSETIFTCQHWLANYAEAEGATPAQFRVEMARELKARLDADIAEDSVTLALGGKPTVVTRYVATSYGQHLLTSYFYVEPRAPQPSRLISCTAEKGEALALARCELALEVLVNSGVPRAEAPPPQVAQLFGGEPALPADCDYGAGLTPGGGRVRCGERLMIRWDALPANSDALSLDNFATGVRQELGGTEKVARDTPGCTFRGAAAVCVRLKAKGGYTFLLAQVPGAEPLLVNCGFRDDADDARSACAALIATAP